MSFLLSLVAFVGIGDKAAGKIDGQVSALFADQADVERVKLSNVERHTLVAHDDGAAEIVRGLRVSGVIAGEVERTRRSATLRVVVYDGEGDLIDLVELPLAKAKSRWLSESGLESLAGTVLPDIEQLNAPPPEPEPAPVVSEAAPASDEIAVATSATPARKRREALLRLSVGVGMRQRQFDPGPSMQLGYRSSSVPGAEVTLEARPLRYLAIGAAFERTLTMTSELEGESAPTSILGWQATAALRLPIGPIEVAALGGVGARHFVIDADAATPTPDGHYVYAVIGGQLALRLGARVELRGFAAFEPVIGGEEPMPGATRRGLEVGGALEVGATDHVFVVGEAGYQRFTSTWDDGTAVDQYPSATLAVGARY